MDLTAGGCLLTFCIMFFAPMHRSSSTILACPQTLPSIPYIQYMSFRVLPDFMSSASSSPSALKELGV